MIDQKPVGQSTSARKTPAGANIGFILDYLHGYQEILWHSASETALSAGDSLFTFVGQSLLRGNDDDARATNMAFAIARSPRIRSFLFSGATLGSYIDQKTFAECLKPFRDRPCVSIGPAPDMPSVLIENKAGIASVVEHLARVHEKKRIAYVSGPEGSPEAAERLESFRAALAAQGLAADEALIYHGNFWYNGGEEAVRELMDKRKAGFDALMAANDYMALGALRELKRRGIRVPQDVPVTGHDDVLEGVCENPALTTIRSPIPGQAREAVRFIVSGGGAPPPPMHTELVVRRSCGCQSMAQELAGRGSFVKGGGSLPTARELSGDIIQVARFANTTREEIERMAETVLSGAASGDFAEFFLLAEGMVFKSAEAGEAVEEWQNLLSVLRGEILSRLGDCDTAVALENVIGRLRIMVASINYTASVAKSSAILQFGEDLGAGLKRAGRAATFGELGSFLAAELKALGMKSFYLALREDILDASENDGWGPEGRMLLHAATSDGKDLLEGKGSRPYVAKDFIPADALPARPASIVVFPITFNNAFFGLAAFEPGPSEGTFYVRISDQISASVQSILLLERSKRAEAAVSARSAAIEALARPMGASVMDVSRIVEERSRTVKSVAEAAAHTRGDIAATMEMIQRMAKGVSEMAKAIKIIEDISDTISLLGLNAAIEAARAGAQGKGFNVIAAEIRKLADSTRENAERTGLSLKGLLKDMDGSVEASKRSQAAFLKLDSDVAAVLASLGEIASRMEGLAASSSELLKTM